MAHLGNQPTSTGRHEQSNPTGFSIGAVLMIVGALAVLGSYLLTWYTVTADASITVSGLGQINSPDYRLETNRLHWAAGAAALGALVIAIFRLLGRYGGAKWLPATIGVGLVGIFGTLFAVAVIPDGVERAGGLWVTLAGTIVMIVGLVLVSVARR